ncbi:MAG: hypothetical protein V1736_00725 [Pseudomonadota bacterium]
MSIFRGLLGAFYYGKALGKFYRRQYSDAARLFEMICGLQSEKDRKQLSYFYLGRSYVALRRYNEALDAMSKAYKLFEKRHETSKDPSEVQQFKDFLSIYSTLLRSMGQIDCAKDVERRQAEL